VSTAPRAWYRRPEIVLFSIFFLVTGIGLGVFVLPHQWHLAGRIAAGVLLGVTSMLMLFANRMIGNTDFD
jgi:hypothetical protein